MRTVRPRNESTSGHLVWLRLKPGIDNIGLSKLEVADIARDDSELVMKSRCGEDRVGNGNGRAGPFRFTGQPAPTFGNVHINGQNTPRETLPEIDIQPRFKLRATLPSRYANQSLADLPESEDAEIECSLVGVFQPWGNIRFGSHANQLRDAICVEKETAHRSISPPLSPSLSKPSSSPTSGESRKN